MKILGKIALIFTGCFLLFAVIGNIALSFNGGVKASFQQVYDRLEEVWPYELFGRAEESLDQIADRLDPPQKAPDSSSSGSGSSSRRWKTPIGWRSTPTRERRNSFPGCPTTSGPP